MAATDLTDLDDLLSFTVTPTPPLTAAEHAAFDAEDERLWRDLQGVPSD